MLAAETASAPERRAAALKGLRAYQDAERRPRPEPMPIVARVGNAAIRDYGGEGPPSLFMPSLINPPFILDLAEGNSLLRWIAGQGMRPLLVEWQSDPPLGCAEGRGTARSAVEGPERSGGKSQDRTQTFGADAPPLPHAPHGPPPLASRGEDLSIAAHIERILLPLVDALGEQPHLVGYCLGGTMALGAAMHARLRSLTLIAAPWHFSGFGAPARADIGALWQAAKPTAQTLGLVPMEVLQSGFWRLDPPRTIGKFEAFGALDPASEQARAFVALEDWANGGDPLSYVAGRELFEDFVGRDVTGKNEWMVGGRVVDPAALAIPAAEFVSLNDRIVPAASAAGLRLGHRLGAGHVGMIVGSRAKAQLWEPLARWLSQVQQN